MVLSAKNKTRNVSLSDFQTDLKILQDLIVDITNQLGLNCKSEQIHVRGYKWLKRCNASACSFSFNSYEKHPIKIQSNCSSLLASLHQNKMKWKFDHTICGMNSLFTFTLLSHRLYAKSSTKRRQMWHSGSISWPWEIQTISEMVNLCGRFLKTQAPRNAKKKKKYPETFSNPTQISMGHWLLTWQWE